MEPNEELKEEFIPVKEAADLLKINVRHVANLINAGKLRAKNITLGSERAHWRVLKSDVMSFDNVRS